MFIEDLSIPLLKEVIVVVKNWVAINIAPLAGLRNTSPTASHPSHSEILSARKS